LHCIVAAKDIHRPVRLSSVFSFVLGVHCFLRSHRIGPNGEL
jgi:hypothetical protein